MTTALPLPIRVLVKGASTVGWTSGMGGARSDFAFSRALEQQLLQDGRPVEVRTYTVPSERAKSTLRHWEAEMIGYSPDVVILVYGHYEAIHLFLPWWLERHANSFKARPGAVRTAYRKRLLRPLWRALVRLQARVDTLVEPTLRRSRPRRVAADLERLIEHVQSLHSPLVLIFELLPPAARGRHYFPGMPQRIAAMNSELAGMVERVARPNVRLFKVSDVVRDCAGGDLDVATPDGFHFTPAVHHAIGVRLATQIAEWADGQQHLGTDGSRAVGDGRLRVARERRTAAGDG